MPSFRPTIRDAYVEILRREPDPSGLETFNRLMNQGLTEARMRETLLRSQEYADNNPEPGMEARIGLNVHVPSLEILDDVAFNLGMTWIRVDFDWFRIEPARGVFDWGATDLAVHGARDRGLEVLATMAYTPRWASSNPGNPQIGDPPASRSFWIDFVRQAVTRYRDSVRTWQLWNEPNIREFWSGSMQQYRTEILETGAPVVKEANADAQIVSPGLANLGNWRDWFREAMRASSVIDVINHHNYADTGRDALNELERDSFLQPSLRTLMRQAGVDNHPFFLTETGRRSDEGDQRQYYEGVVAALREKTWVNRVFFFHYWDGPGQGNGGFGIVNEDFSPKPAYRFLQTVLDPRQRLSVARRARGAEPEVKAID